MSLLLGGIGINSALMLLHTAQAKAKFWLGSPSWPPLFESLNMRANSLSIKPLKYKPFILWYLSHRTTPSRYVMATTNFATLPPDPQWEPFAVHPQASSSILFSKCARGARTVIVLMNVWSFMQILISFSDLYLLRDHFGMLVNTCILGYEETIVLFGRKPVLDWRLLAA